jgi:signal transduction histidine kinase
VGRPSPTVDVQVPADVVAEIARPRLVQALTNVLENAIDSYEGVEVLQPVVVRVERPGGRVTIVVEDRGCGMSAEAQADAIKLFATNKPNGTGFGLPLVVKIVESEHGGRVELDSQQGRGTTVRITIRTHR